MRSTPALPSPYVSTTLSRNVVLVACAASAGVHAGLVPSHLVENLWLGIAFAASVGLLLALIVSLWSTSDPRRLAPLEEDVEPVDAIGLLTQGVQVAGLIAALHLCHPTAARARAVPEGNPQYC